jgi:hypothetical protein
MDGSIYSQDDRKIPIFKVSKESDRAPQPVEDSSPDALWKLRGNA